MDEFTVAEVLAGERSWGPPGANEKWKRAARRLIASGLVFDQVWIVMCEDSSSSYVETVWSTEEAATMHAARMNNGELYIHYSVLRPERVRLDVVVDDPVYDDD